MFQRNLHPTGRPSAAPAPRKLCVAVGPGLPCCPQAKLVRLGPSFSLVKSAPWIYRGVFEEKTVFLSKKPGRSGFQKNSRGKQRIIAGSIENYGFRQKLNQKPVSF